MKDRKPRKWITWEIPEQYLKDTTEKQAHELDQQLQEEVSKALEDMMKGLLVSMKITNLPKDF